MSESGKATYRQHKKVLIGPTSFGDSGDEPFKLLDQHGLFAVKNPLKRKLTAEEVIAYGVDCVGILAGSEPLMADVLQKLPNLRCISRCGTGLDNVDVEAARSLGIFVYNTPDALTRAVAEFALGLLLALLRRIPLVDRSVRQGIWRKETGALLTGKTVGIVGLGRIGRAFAEMLLALGCQVYATDPKPDHKWLGNHSVEMVSLEALLKNSDVVSLHPALTPETRHLIGETELALMNPSAFLLNLSRGEVLDETALVMALREGRLAGAALDVFAEEPYRGPLVESNSVILTPHIGSRAREAKLRMEVEAVNNLLDGLRQSFAETGGR